MRIRQIEILSLLAWAVIAFISAPIAGATTVKPLTLYQMSQGSELIVEGVVLDKHSRWDESGQYIITEVSIEVTRTLKGPATGRITVRVLGGEVGDVGMFVAGSPKFETGKEVLLLLESHPISDWRVVGFQQGKFEISTDPKTGDKRATGPAQTAPMSLKDLETLIKYFVQGKQP